MRITVRDADRRAIGRQLLCLAECVAGCRAFIQHEVDTPFHVANEQVELAVTVPIDGKHSGGVRNLDRLARLILEGLFAGKLAFAQSFEEIKLTGPGTGENVGNAVAVQVHELWSETDASARRDGAVGFAVQK